VLRLVALVALTLGGCAGGFGAPAIEATFPPSSDGLVDAMVVSLVDQTGLVTGTTPAVGGVTGDGGPKVVAEPGDANALRIEWLGNDCDGRTSIVFVASGDADGYLATIHVDPTPAGGFGCQQIDLPRALTVRLRQPIAPDRVTITQQFP
jgi:hypothetical protein